MAARQPPRFVPTLTEVVVPSVAGAAGSARAGAMLAEEQLVHRIMQRIDLTLERRLREAVATVVIEQTRLGMLVGVAVGWELAERLEARRSES